MDALEFFKARKRMCVATDCNNCKLYHTQAGCIITQYEKIDTCEETIAIVEQWAKEHPIKTRQSVFLEQWPEAAISKDGAIAICPLAISAAYRHGNGTCNKGNSDTCADCKRQFWLAEVGE